MEYYVPNDLKWGVYGDFEGWYTFGPAHPPSADTTSPIDRCYLAVTCKTESPRGCPGAVNAYDACQISVGYLQLCQTFFLSTNLLGYLLDRGVSITPTLQQAMDQSSTTFKKNPRGQWRLYRNGVEVLSARQNCEVFFGGVSGKKGSWNDSAKELAKLWVGGWQETLLQPLAIEFQMRFLEARIPGWVGKQARQRLWGPGTPPKEDKGWAGAVRSMYLSFSANNTVLAETNLMRLPSNLDLFSEEGFVKLGNSLTFSPGNPAIYPKRCGDIFPEIERIFGVNIPDNSKELQQWLSQRPNTPDLSLKEAQQLLIRLGYDLGPKGADGIWGKKSEAATRQFQAFYGLDVTGSMDLPTVVALLAASKV